jgi:amino acid adenylation domain-containing protein
MPGIDETISGLTPEKRAMLRARLAKRSPARNLWNASAVPAPNGDLSVQQESLWFFDRVEPCRPVYNIAQVIRIEGPLDRVALQAAFSSVVARHEQLRARFCSRDGAPWQVIQPPEPFNLPHEDLSNLPPEQREREVESKTGALAGQPFHLEDGLLIRATLLSGGSEEHWLVLALHHIAADLWSLRVLYRDLAEAYAAHRDGRPPVWPELKSRYADYVAHQRAWMASADFQTALSYWKKQLAGAPRTLDLYTDAPRPPVQSFRGGRVTFKIAAETLAAIKQLSRQQSVTPYMTLLAAFQILLHRYTGAEELLVGSPVAARTRTDWEALVGFFANSIVLCSSCAGDPPFREFLKQVRATVLDGHARQDVPFEKIVEELRVPRDASRNPLFQVTFQYQPASVAALEMEDLKVEISEACTGTAKFDLNVAISETSSGAHGILEYSSDLFRPETAARMMRHFQTLLQSIIDHPDERVSRLPLLSPSEREDLLRDWNATATVYPRHARIDELFAGAAQKHPEAVAVRFGRDLLRWRELSAQSNQLARRLKQLGLQPGMPVGFCLERSPRMVVAMLAILKAGGTYVPLDPDYPRERLAFMVEDTGMPVMLTERRLAERLPRFSGTVLQLDADWKSIAAESEAPVESRGGAESIAYIIYTSGSTGVPKGVPVPHRAVVRLVRDTNYIQITSGDSIAQASNSSFDAATFEIWGALLNGAPLVGVSKGTLLSPRDLAEFLEREKITTLFLTTALFNQIAAETPRAFRHLKHLLFGGEAVDPNAVRTILREGAPQRLLHVYGPTENTTFSSWHLVKDVPKGAGTIPIGRAISNTQLYVLDRNLAPVPPGVPGELHAGGDGLAQGYLQRPKLTAEKFIPHPFKPDPDERLYKTGDLVRLLPDGHIEFLGRLDQQIKIRGFRVELEEIEIQIKTHPAVREAVVLLREDSPGDKRLVAYFTGSTTEPNPPHLRSFLSAKLPDYMVPAHFVRLEKLPLSPNGKVDRRALPVPDLQPIVADSPTTPRGSLEAELQSIWEDVLGRKPIGIRENFFDLGGHSILAVKVFAQIEKRLGKKLSILNLFKSPTIEALAALIRDEGWTIPGSSLVEIQPAGSRPPVFWLHTLGGGGGGGLFTYRKLALLLGEDQPSYGFIAPPAPYTRIEAMAAYYIDQMRAIQPQGPYLLGGYCFGGIVAFEMARQLESAGEEIAMVALIESMLSHGDSADRWRLAWHAVRTLPAWTAAFFNQPPGELRSRMRHRIAAIRRKTLSLLGSSRRRRVEASNELALLGEIIDLSRYPKDFKRYAEAHWKALLCYRPESYSGRVTLFRTRRPRLFSFEPEVSWSRLATGGVDLRIIPGTHELVLEEPYVRALAVELRKTLAACIPSEQLEML